MNNNKNNNNNPPFFEVDLKPRLGVGKGIVNPEVYAKKSNDFNDLAPVGLRLWGILWQNKPFMDVRTYHIRRSAVIAGKSLAIHHLARYQVSMKGHKVTFTKWDENMAEAVLGVGDDWEVIACALEIPDNSSADDWTVLSNSTVAVYETN